MPKYRAFILKDDGTCTDKQTFECADDAAAVRKALDLVDGHAVELWGPRGVIGKFKHPHRDWPKA